MNGTVISVPKYIHIKAMLHFGWPATATMNLCRRELMTRLRSQWLIIYLLWQSVFPSGNPISHNVQVTPTGSLCSWVLLHERLLEYKHPHCAFIKLPHARAGHCQDYWAEGLQIFTFTYWLFQHSESSHRRHNGPMAMSVKQSPVMGVSHVLYPAPLVEKHWKPGAIDRLQLLPSRNKMRQRIPCRGRANKPAPTTA